MRPQLQEIRQRLTRHGPWFLLAAAFLFRLGYGLCSEFWSPDERQIYLLGLEFFTTGQWPFFGPDVVTKSQIPGALQALLVGLPFHILPIPEAPFLLLNGLSFGALSLLAWYCTRRLPGLPRQWVWAWVLTAPWVLNFSTHVVNPSYVLPAAVLFFVGFVDIWVFHKNPLLPLRLSVFLMGFCLIWVMQLHMSWVLLPFFVLGAALVIARHFRKQWPHLAVWFVLGACITGALLLPTLVRGGFWAGGTGTNVVLQTKNLLNIFTILARFLSFASFELARLIGVHTADRMQFLQQHLWLAPFAVISGIVGLVWPVAMIVLWFFSDHPAPGWKEIRQLSLATVVLVYGAFFFSVTEPRSHTFYLVFPLAMMYSLWCYQRIAHLRVARWVAGIFVGSCLLFHAGLGWAHLNTLSLYVNRQVVVQALEEKEHRILGTRRPVEWKKQP